MNCRVLKQAVALISLCACINEARMVGSVSLRVFVKAIRSHVRPQASTSVCIYNNAAHVGMNAHVRPVDIRHSGIYVPLVVAICRELNNWISRWRCKPLTNWLSLRRTTDEHNRPSPDWQPRPLLLTSLARSFATNPLPGIAHSQHIPNILVHKRTQIES